jgi:hypothetical protein
MANRAESRVLSEALSRAGRRVTLAEEKGGYTGAQTFFTVTRYQTDGHRPQQQRFTPFRERAVSLFRAFTADVSDPEELANLVK